MEQTTTGPKLAHLSSDGQRTQTVQEHLEGTAKLAADFARPFGEESQAYLAGLLHDIGKYSDDFQRRLPAGRCHPFWATEKGGAPLRGLAQGDHLARGSPACISER